MKAEIAKSIKKIKNFIIVVQKGSYSTMDWLTTRCPDYKDYELLPEIVEFNNKLYRKSCFNPDEELCEYNTNLAVNR